MNALQTYTYINARLRARLASLLDGEIFTRIAQANTLEEALTLLNGTYYTAFYEHYRQSGDLIVAEQALVQLHLQRFANLSAGLNMQVRGFMKALLMLHEVRYLKTALGVWFYREIGHKHAARLSLYAQRLSIAHTIAYDELMAAGSLSDIASQLASTPYGQIIQAHESQVMQQRSVYSLEVALDRLVFEKLYQATLLLPASERITIRVLLGYYIDLENIEFGRGLVLYGINQASRLEGEFLAGGTRLTKEKWLEVIFNEQALSDLLVSWYPSLQADVQEGTSQLLQLAQERLLLEGGRQALTSYPFSCAPIVAYFFLIEHDLQRLITLFNGKAYGLSSQELMHKLML